LEKHGYKKKFSLHGNIRSYKNLNDFSFFPPFQGPLLGWLLCPPVSWCQNSHRHFSNENVKKANLSHFVSMDSNIKWGFSFSGGAKSGIHMKVSTFMCYQYFHLLQCVRRLFAKLSIFNRWKSKFHISLCCLDLSESIWTHFLLLGLPHRPLGAGLVRNCGSFHEGGDRFRPCVPRFSLSSHQCYIS